MRDPGPRDLYRRSCFSERKAFAQITLKTKRTNVGCRKDDAAVFKIHSRLGAVMLQPQRAGEISGKNLANEFRERLIGKCSLHALLALRRF